MAAEGPSLEAHLGPALGAIDALCDTSPEGEVQITASQGRIKEIFLGPVYVKPMPETLSAIADADVITVGPGSLFTSLIPNLLVHGIAEALARSSATKIYVCNLMTQANESLGLSAADRRHFGR